MNVFSQQLLYRQISVIIKWSTEMVQLEYKKQHFITIQDHSYVRFCFHFRYHNNQNTRHKEVVCVV